MSLHTRRATRVLSVLSIALSEGLLDRPTLGGEPFPNLIYIKLQNTPPPPPCYTHPMLPLVTAFAAARYNETRVAAWSDILIQCRELTLSSADPERALLDWLSAPHAAELERACKRVLEEIGSAANDKTPSG